jgi:hypothetical protein
MNRGNRTLYAHWLDPEYLTWRARSIFDMRQRQQKIETLLKMHAVIGDCIRLSDVQLTDSLAILTLFNNPDFRQFVDAFPDFFSLRSRPATEFDKIGSEQLATVLNGLGRALGQGWFSSTFENVEVVRDIAKKFASVTNEEDAIRACNSLLRNLPQERVSGLLYGVRHFCSVPDRVTSCKDSGSFYDTVLAEAENRLIREGASTDLIKSTLRFVEKYPDKERHRRTPAIIALHEAGLGNAANRVAYFNIIQAWNIGVSNTLQAHRDEAPAFDIVDPLPLYFGQFREATLETNITLADQEVLEGVSTTNWHPAQLTWETIRRIRGDETCRTQIAAYQQKLTTGNVVDKEFRSLTAAVASALSTESLRPLENFAQHTAIGRDIGNIMSCLGLGLSSVNSTLGFACLIGARAVSLPHDVSKLVLWTKKVKSKPEIAAGIKDYAIRYNLHRWTNDGEESSESE